MQKKRWVLLDPNFSREDFILREMGMALRRQGCQVSVVRSAGGEKGELRKPDEIRELLRKAAPDGILWCSVSGLPYFQLLTEDEWGLVPKVCLWFDDPVTRSECIQLGGVMKATAGRADFFHFVWDGYWRKEVQRRWGIESHPIHLSADEEEYHPDRKMPSERFSLGGSDAALVFIGMLHAMAGVKKCLDPLPRGLKALSSVIQARLERVREDPGVSPRGTDLSWDQLWEVGIQEVSTKEKILIGQEVEREPLALCSFRYGVWALAKNAVRIRMLRQALKAAPLWIFSEQKQLGHCREEELRKMLGEEGDRLRIFDTSGLPAEQLGRLYSCGILHLQATDPQSVEGGIPIRVFQAAAAGRALLTDSRAELRECFESGSEMLMYDRANEFGKVLEKSLGDVDRLREVGRRARARFEAGHTWRHRWGGIEAVLSGK